MAGVQLSSEEIRQAKYDLKYDPTTVGLKVAAQLPGMKTGFSAAIISLVQAEQQIQGILNDDGGVSIIQYPFYLNFGREVWKKVGIGIAGPALTSESQLIADKYIAYGLDCTILAKIALDVFTVVVTCPTP